MPYELCRHVKTNGKRCKSPALTGGMWCYFHDRLITRHRDLRALRPKSPMVRFALPALEDRESIQVALSLVADAIVRGVLEEKRASVLLRAIGIASRNVSSVITEPEGLEQMVRELLFTLDGSSLACRQMDDHREPPPDESSSAPPQTS